MTRYYGDLSTNASLRLKFTTVNATAGKPTSLSSGTVKVWKGNSTANSSAGITLSKDFGGTTGLNHITLNTSSNTYYAAGSDYQVVLNSGTVNSVSVKGYVVGAFSLKNRQANVKYIKSSSVNADNLVTRVDAAISSRLPTTAASVNVTKIKGTTANADNLVTRVDATISSRMPSTAVASVNLTKVKGSSATVDNWVTRVDATVSSRMGSTESVNIVNPQGVQKNTALNAFEFLMVDSADHVSPKTGLAVTAQRSIDGSTFGTAANAVTELANGIYKINLAAGDVNGDVVTLKFTAAGADARYVTVKTVQL